MKKIMKLAVLQAFLALAVVSAAFAVTSTCTETSTFTVTSTCTETSTFTVTSTRTEISTFTVTSTRTETSTFTVTSTRTETSTFTVTSTRTATNTPGIPSVTATATIEPVSNTLNAGSAAISSGSVIDLIKGDKVRIKYQVKKSGEVKIMVFDRTGRLIKIVLSDKRDPGEYDADWDGMFGDGSKVSAGIYIIHVQIGDYTKKLKVAVKK